MGAMIFCNLCKKELFQLDPDNPKTITGEEICETCEGRIEAAFVLLEKAVKEFIKGLKQLRDSAKQQYSQFDSIFATYSIECEEMHLRLRKEMQTLKDNAVKGKE